MDTTDQQPALSHAYATVRRNLLRPHLLDQWYAEPVPNIIGDLRSHTPVPNSALNGVLEENRW
jgi:hypothetical protein